MKTTIGKKERNQLESSKTAELKITAISRGHDSFCGSCGNTWNGGGVCPIHIHGRSMLQAIKGLLEDLEEMQTNDVQRLSVERTAEWIGNLKRIIGKVE